MQQSRVTGGERGITFMLVFGVWVRRLISCTISLSLHDGGGIGVARQNGLCCVVIGGTAGIDTGGM